MLSRQLTPISRNICIDPLGLLLGKLGQFIPIPFQAIRDVICRLGISQLQDGIIVESPILGILILTPDLVTLDAEDLEPNTSWCRHVVRDEFWCQ